MGQSLKTLTSGGDEKKGNEIVAVIEECYDKYFVDAKEPMESAEFYQAICQTVEELNKKLGSTQFRVPTTPALKEAYELHHQGKGKALTKEQFLRILQDLTFKTGFTGIGAKDMLLYIFGVPATTLFLKQKIAPKAVPNEVFIPVVTSATVFLLAKLNKI